MRRFRLNLWQRIGVVLCLVWMVIGGSWGWRHAYDKADAEFRVCIAAVKIRDRRASLPRHAVSRDRGAERRQRRNRRARAHHCRLGCLSMGLVWLVRRIRRAFSPEPRRVDAAQPPPTAPNEEPTLSPANPGPVPTALASGPVAIGLQTRPAPPVAPDIRKSANKRTVEKYMDAFATIRSSPGPVVPDGRR